MKIFKILRTILILILYLYFEIYIFPTQLDKAMFTVGILLMLIFISNQYFYKIYLTLSLLLISTSTVLYAVDPAMIRYFYYIQKFSTWSFYYFLFGSVFMLTPRHINMFFNRKKNNVESY